jgi:S1-C subfamily serine protease
MTLLMTLLMPLLMPLLMALLTALLTALRAVLRAVLLTPLRAALRALLPAALGAAIVAPSAVCAVSAPAADGGAVPADASAPYSEVILILPDKDPRGVGPQAVAALEGMGFRVHAVGPDKPVDIGQGTGFFISDTGYLLTCAHVLGDAIEATVTVDGRSYGADVVKTDMDADVALVKLRGPLAPEASIAVLRRPPHDIDADEDVFTIGYPLDHLPGESERMTRGRLEESRAAGSDPLHVRIRAPVPAGNAGGPLLDREGFVVGLVQQTTNPWRLPRPDGAGPAAPLPRALKTQPLLDFLVGASADAFQSVRYSDAGGLENAGHAVARVEAGATHPRRLVVRLDYVSSFDIWYRFKFFALTAFDSTSEKALFVATPPRDLLVSNEETVIQASFAQFRAALHGR